MATDSKISADEAKKDDPSQFGDEYYADDVEAAAIADVNIDPESLKVNEEEEPVTSGEMRIGDLDDDEMLKRGSKNSYDEEAVPAGDNVI